MKQEADVVASYDRVAEAYAKQFADELDAKPLDRALLAVLVEQTRRNLPILDLGCGPGHAGQYVTELGRRVIGIDLSPKMIAVARKHAPEVDLRVGSMLSLDVESSSVGGIVALYALVHLEPKEIELAFREMARVLVTGGLALVSFHVGSEHVQRDEFLGQPVKLDFRFQEMLWIVGALDDAGFSVEARIERAAYVAVEHPSTRGYVLVAKR